MYSVREKVVEGFVASFATKVVLLCGLPSGGSVLV